MSALKEFVDKVRRAVTGNEAPPVVEAKPFEWEPTPVPGSTPAPLEPAPEAMTPAPAPASWKRPAAPASSVVGSTIPADVADFATVYKGAGLQPPAHGYGVDRVGQMLGHRSLVGLDRNVKASAVLAALDAAGVALEDVVQDAVLRYKALVAFEAAKDLETATVRPRSLRRIEELKREIEEFQKRKNTEMDALTRQTNTAIQSLFRLKNRARGEEDRMYRAVALFVESLPARVLPMGPKPVELKLPLAEPKPGPKLVVPALEPTPAAAPSPAATPAAPSAEATLVLPAAAQAPAPAPATQSALVLEPSIPAAVAPAPAASPAATEVTAPKPAAEPPTEAPKPPASDGGKG
jgi:hypothetical protein